jgi:hypothetical protein
VVVTGHPQETHLEGLMADLYTSPKELAVVSVTLIAHALDMGVKHIQFNDDHGTGFVSQIEKNTYRVEIHLNPTRASVLGVAPNEVSKETMDILQQRYILTEHHFAGCFLSATLVKRQ